MNLPGQYQNAEDVGDSIDWGATINGFCEASLAYPHGNDGVQTGAYNLQHHTMISQPNIEGLELGYP